MKNIHIKSNQKHDNLCNLVAELARSLGHSAKTHVEYPHGEIDVYIDNHIYIECKSNTHEKAINKAINQCSRAGRYGLCDLGYMVSYTDVIKVYEK